MKTAAWRVLASTALAVLLAGCGDDATTETVPIDAAADICRAEGKRLPTYYEWTLASDLWSRSAWKGGTGCVGADTAPSEKTLVERWQYLQCPVDWCLGSRHR